MIVLRPLFQETRMRRSLAFLPLFLLAACGSKADDGSSADEQRQLNAAAASIDVNNTAPNQPDDQGNAQ